MAERRPRKMLVADLLCGAGGSSTGAARALRELGLEMELVCVNHSPIAIKTHSLNHPEARHYVQDIATVRPHLLVPEGYLDLLMASPTCTHHSVARGGKPTSDQERSDPWHIITWLTELRVKRFIIENVWEFTGWCPVDLRTGRPMKSRRGQYFQQWISTIRGLGNELEWRKLNAANYGGATTRQRFILKGRNDRILIGWAPLTHAKRAEANVLQFAGMKQWRPSREIIDWNIKGRSIFNRKKPLAPKTLMRIFAGAVKHKWPQPFIVVLRNHMTAQGIDVPLPTIAANGQHIGLAVPVIMNGRKGSKALPVSTDPIPTLDTKGGIWLAEPMILSAQNSGAPRSVAEPLPTITTGGAGVQKRQGCARPMLAEPFVLSQASGGSPRSVEDPMPTAPTGGAHALISPYYGSGSGETCTSGEDPLPTLTAKARCGLVVPVTHNQGGNGSRSFDEPIPTVTTAKGGEFAVVMPITHDDGSDRSRNVSEPLPTITGANRGELAIIQSINVINGSGEQYDECDRYDILFRMLEPHELAAAMGFTTDEYTYEFAGTKTEQIKQIGNAVSVEMMQAEVKAIMADAAPKMKPLTGTEADADAA